MDFSDVPGEAASQATLAASLATTSASILEQSYGKTWLNSTVSATTIRMPNPTTGYLPNHTSDLHTDAMSAYEAIHGAGSLAAYDIVGVHFAGIGLESSNGINFSGLEGGSRQWLQGTTNSNTVIHEFGHNYGIGHASYWGHQRWQRGRQRIEFRIRRSPSTSWAAAPIPKATSTCRPRAN